MGTFGNIWELLGTFRNCWELLGTFPKFQKIRATSPRCRVPCKNVPISGPISGYTDIGTYIPILGHVKNPDARCRSATVTGTPSHCQAVMVTVNGSSDRLGRARCQAGLCPGPGYAAPAAVSDQPGRLSLTWTPTSASGTLRYMISYMIS